MMNLSKARALAKLMTFSKPKLMMKLRSLHAVDRSQSLAINGHRWPQAASLNVQMPPRRNASTLAISELAGQTIRSRRVAEEPCWHVLCALYF